MFDEPAGTELTLGELRQVQVGILQEFDRLCRAEGLVYFLAYGTLLGAVRHGGYIPWDDDIDVMMPRDDYERLIVAFSAGAVPRLALGSWRTQADWPLPYAKISDLRTELWEPFEVPVALGVNIDVFPVDDVPARRTVRRVQSLLLRFLRWALELKYIAVERGRAWHHPLAIVIGKPILRLVPMGWLVRALDRTARLSRSHTGDRMGVLVGSFEWAVPRSSLVPSTEVAFEGTWYLAPRDPDGVLAEVYGRYRQLPPEHQRISEHAFTAAWRPLHGCERPDG